MSSFSDWLPLLFFLVAIIYSAVGFAGGSSYLALLVFAGWSYQQVPQTALVCNLIVSATAFWHFYRAGHFRLHKVLPFAVLSIPMAYWGGRMHISHELFSILLGFSLCAASLRLFWSGESVTSLKPASTQAAWTAGLPIGAGLGFLSGLVGIGGGIFLSPLLLIFRWVNAKEAAAAASFFILVNSLSGLAGQLHKGSFAAGSSVLFLALAVLLGGQIGARLGSYRLPKMGLQRITAALILYVSVKLISQAF